MNIVIVNKYYIDANKMFDIGGVQGCLRGINLINRSKVPTKLLNIFLSIK